MFYHLSASGLTRFLAKHDRNITVSQLEELHKENVNLSGFTNEQINDYKNVLKVEYSVNTGMIEGDGLLDKL